MYIYFYVYICICICILIANEWDAYYKAFKDAYKGAVFATTMRDPVDRYYSQYRFEHLERRDGSAPGAPRRYAT